MNNFLADLRYGIGMIVKTPGVAVLAITALSLGIGLTKVGPMEALRYE